MKYNFPELDAVRHRIGATLPDWTLKTDLDPREQIREELATGIDIKSINEVDTLGPLLVYKGEQVILYIKDARFGQEPRFHVAECHTLESMRREGRFERYVVTQKTSGFFTIHRKDEWGTELEPREEKLDVCRNCLRLLNWRGYANPWMPQTKNKIVAEFDIAEFLAQYATFFHSLPSRKDTAPPDDYVRNWNQISERLRRERNWTCEICGVVSHDHPGLLHGHHKNGVVSDNSEENLQTLCWICHAKQPHHRNMKVPLDKRLLLERLRREQGLPPP